MKYINSFTLTGLLAASLLLGSCTDLTEEINDGLVPEAGNVDVQLLLNDAYTTLWQFQVQDNIWSLQEHSSDEVMGPTRGTDWDDNGVWRTLHDHTWDSEHNFIRNSFNSMGRGLYLANNVLAFNPSQEQEMAARFLRAFYMYIFVDHWGQVPTREPGSDIALADPAVLNSTDATNFIISELEAILPNLPDNTDAWVASKDAARALLAKMYLNKGVWTGDRANPSFSAADMNKVIEYCDAIISSGNYAIDDDYYDNFRPNNDQVSSELIFSSKNDGGIQGGEIRARWHMTLHYNQNPSGWNGFCTIADFYDKFDDPNDVRLSAEPADLTPVSGLHAGFLAGQQFNKDGVALNDRRGNPLVFTKEVDIFETGNNLEVTGIRGIKYIPDFVNVDRSDNDYAIFRYSDVLLMKAEAIARGGTATGGDTPTSLVNSIREKRNATLRGNVDLDAIYNERGYELWWEGHRRQDQIRFGKFLEPWAHKRESDPTRLLFPIPAIELSANPNLQQNPGY